MHDYWGFGGGSEPWLVIGFRYECALWALEAQPKVDGEVSAASDLINRSVVEGRSTA
jgi:hypothetical protein